MSAKLMDNAMCNELPVLFLLFYRFIFYSEEPVSACREQVCMFCVSLSSQVTFIYIALLTIQIVSKHLTVSSWRIECQ